ncbi:ABC transporter substrate-binding protein [Paenibacillus thiaminolyticus]|uniref:ABC transporter substrate-binding protein n=1 Tax=Paenibacillus thiaminolyticus TaxID=49283 RepID=UPI001602317C|nr:extracellular solute-binding protein [Paenibacillus thiaminolyticus]
MMRLSAIAKKGLLLLGSVVLLSGCFGSKSVLEELVEEGKGTIKVLYYNEDDFYREYGNAFNVKFPNIKFDIVSTKELMARRISGEDFDYRSELAKWVDLHKPDVLLLGRDEYEEYAQAGKLFNLEPIIKQEQFDVDGYMPGLIDSLREKGGGSLYGLTPNFFTSVIYYNADLFAEHGIELPRIGLSWADLFRRRQARWRRARSEAASRRRARQRQARWGRARQRQARWRRASRRQAR